MKFKNLFKRKKISKKTTPKQDIDILSSYYYSNNPPPIMGQMYSTPPQKIDPLTPPTLTKPTPDPMQMPGIVIPPPQLSGQTIAPPASSFDTLYSHKQSSQNMNKDFFVTTVPQSNGKEICKKTREIRQEYAQNLGIKIPLEECTYKGPCSGTCPKCEQELEIINNLIAQKESTNNSGKN